MRVVHPRHVLVQLFMAADEILHLQQKFIFSIIVWRTLFIDNGASIYYVRNGVSIVHKNDVVILYWKFFTKEILQNMIFRRLRCNTIVVERNFVTFSQVFMRLQHKSIFNRVVTSYIKMFSHRKSANLNIECPECIQTMLWWNHYNRAW